MQNRKRVTFGIAEDEQVESDAMKLFIERTFPDAEVIWQCPNGKRALEQTKKEPPDILIADIEMPVLDGLELCQALYDSAYEGVILIHTAYEKFAYTRRAIQLKVYDYILKPMEDEELEEVLGKCIQESERRKKSHSGFAAAEQSGAGGFAHAVSGKQGTQKQKISEFTFSILQNGNGDREDTVEFFDILGWREREIRAFVVRLIFPRGVEAGEIRKLEELTAYLMECGYQVLTEYSNGSIFQMVVQPGRDMELCHWYTAAWMIADMIRQETGGARVSVSPLCRTPDEIMNECRKKDVGGLQAEWTFPHPTWRQIRRRDAERYGSILERYIREKNWTKIFLLVKRTEGNVQDWQEFLWELLRIYLEKVREIWPALKLGGLEKELLNKSSEPRSGMKWLTQLCMQQPEQETDDMISTVLSWMERDFANNLTQAGVAERFGMDPAYFSRFFKKKTGKNFSQVMTEIRMRHAEQMIQEKPKITLEELCDACGLVSKSYFSEVFKKWKGMTITQYLEKLQK